MKESIIIIPYKKMPKDTGVYLIESVKTKRRYVGSSENFSCRISDHKSRLKNGTHHSIKLQRHFNKYGTNDLFFKILEVCESNKKIEIEQKYIDLLRPYFNSCLFAKSTKGFKHTEETRKKLSKAKSGEKHWAWGKKFSKEHCERIRVSHKKIYEKGKTPEGFLSKIYKKGTRGTFTGKNHRCESKQKISQANKGKIGLIGELNPMYGKKHPDETILKMREKRKGRKPSLGMVHSDESKQKMSERRKGVKFAPRTIEHSLNLSISNSKKQVLKITQDGLLLNEYLNCRVASRDNNICHTTIAKACRGSLKTAGGFIWKYKTTEYQQP